jgi:signal transduction histidine kinase
METSSLDAVAWLETGDTMNMLFSTRMPTSTKERLAPISVLDHAEKGPAIVIDDAASSWPNDVFLSSGTHPWFLVMPIFNQDAKGATIQNVGPVLATLFLEFPTQTAFARDELMQLGGLCVQAIGCLRSVWRKQMLSKTGQELMQAKEQLFTYSRTLEQKIRTRTLELLDQTNTLRAEVKDRIRAQEESAAAQSRAEAALQVKEQFLATMSHELRTPFNGVMGMIQLLQDTDMTKKQQEYLGILKDSSLNLLSLLNDILDYTKIESGDLQFDHFSLSIRDVCESVIDDHFELAKEKSIDLAYISENEETDWIISDPVRLRQLIRCYVENAIKFNQNRGGFIVVTSHMTFLKEADEINRPRYRLSISCADTGPGISDVSALFVPFSQVDNSMRRRYGGTGLGLAICKRLVELLNGDAWCHSVVGQGSTFYFNMVNSISHTV